MKNTSRKVRPETQDKKNAPKGTSREEAASRMEAESEKANAAALKKKELQTGKEREVLYRVSTLRDAGILKAFITFNYRVFHPSVTSRMVLYGILMIVPGFFVRVMWARIVLFVIGALTLLLAFARQYISLALTKRSDIDYRNRTAFIYDFTSADMSFYRNGQLMTFAKYKDIAGFYYDDRYYYLGLTNHEFHILPKDRFVTGEWKDFEEFIYKKSRKTCRWIPDKFRDKLAKRRAARRIAAK